MSKASYIGPLTRYYGEELKQKHREYIERRNNTQFSKFVIDENDIPFLGKKDNLPFDDVKCYTYKHSQMPWDEFYRQGDSKRGITVKVLENGRYGVIYYSCYEWGHKKALKENVMGNARQEFE